MGVTAYRALVGEIPAPKIPSFVRNMTVILCWPGDDQLWIESCGEKLLLPARDQVSVPGVTGTSWRWPSAVDENGIPIPGTVVVEDIWGVGPDPKNISDYNLSPAEWPTILSVSAEQFARVLYDNRSSNGLWARGFGIAKDVEEAKEFLAKGRALWEQSEDEWADREIRTELMRIDTWEKRGQPAPTSSSAASVKRAFEHKKRRATNRPAYTAEQLKAALLGVTEDEVPVVKPVEPVSPLPPPSFEKPISIGGWRTPSGDLSSAELAQDLLAQCEKKGIDLSAAELKGLLKGDEKVLEAVNDRLDAKG